MSSLSWVKWLEYRGDCRISLLPEVRFEGLCDLEHIKTHNIKSKNEHTQYKI